MGTRPNNLGLHDGKLSPCPDKPNCVCSQCNSDDSHFIEPLKYQVDSATAWDKLIQLVSETPRTAAVRLDSDYAHFESTSFLFRFVDDVEFSHDKATKLIHVRSASRLGRSDLGVNRKRIEDIRSQLAQNKEL